VSAVGIYLDLRFWNELSADPKKIDEETRSHYAKLYGPAACACTTRVRAVRRI